MSDGNVVDLSLRRAKQRKDAGEESRDPVIRAAEKLTALYGELAMEVSASELFTAVALAERATMVMFINSVGEGHARSLAQEGLRKALQYKMNDPTHYRGPTVFDREDPDG